MKSDYSPGEPGSGRSPHRIVLITALCVVGAAMLISRESVATRQPQALVELAPAPDPTEFEQALQSAMVDPVPTPPASDWHTVKVNSGDTLAELFTAQGLQSDDWIALLQKGGDALRLKRLKIGDELHLRIQGGQLQELRYALDEVRTLQMQREGEGEDFSYSSHTLTAALDRQSRTASGVIRSSLFVDAGRAGVSDRLIMQFAELFGYDVDFTLDLREGDSFSVVVEELYRDGEKLRDGDILAAEFVNQGKTFRALRFVDGDGQAAYYTPEGQSLKKAFLRSPIEFARISSHFNLSRRHPILNTIRAHKGTDYAAGSGTPIRAVGDGKVSFVGVKNGYGNVVVVQHGSQYETLYAHMSRFRPGTKVGTRVQQGQVIGYVGSTGLATAPHLHYEFRVAGVHKNPVTVALPRSNPLPDNRLAQFRSQSAPLLAALDASHSQMAAAPQAGGSPVNTAR